MIILMAALLSNAQLNQLNYTIKYIHNQPFATAIVQVNDTVNYCKLTEMGVLIHTKLNKIVTCDIPFAKIEHVKGLSCVQAIEVSNFANSMRVKNDGAIQHSHVDKVQEGLSNNLNANYDGSNVIVGIVDIGFQTDHPTFYAKSDTSLRIKRFWDQSATGTAPSGYDYGHECKTSIEITNQIDVDGTHGTHVAGIAAGSGLSTRNYKYRGMAPNADLVFVKIKYSNEQLEGSAYGDYIVANPTIIDAYKYIFDYATQVGKPAVINLSWGMHTGPHDGTSLFDLAVAELVKTNGHIIVGANGNEGSSQMHFRHDFNNDTIATIPYDVHRSNTIQESVYVDIWGTKNTPFNMQIHLYDTLKNKLASSTIINTFSTRDIGYWFSSNADTAWIQLSIDSSYANNQKPNILVIANHNNPKKNFLVIELMGSSGRIDAWNSGDAYVWSSGGFTNRIKSANFSPEERFKGGDNQNTLGENGGTGKGTISVGAYINRNIWINRDNILTDRTGEYEVGSAAGFSSNGPSIDGRIKPDISAPGQHITSAGNRRIFTVSPNNDLMEISVFNNDTNFWMQYSGTSMAAPHVTGIVALMLQANPKLSSQEVATSLKSTAQADKFTGDLPNNKWGYGKVDALKALKEVERISGIKSTTFQNVKLYPNPTQNNIHIDGLPNQSMVSLYDLSGKLIMTQSIIADNYVLQLPDNAGVYIVNINSNGYSYTERVVKY